MNNLSRRVAIIERLWGMDFDSGIPDEMHRIRRRLVYGPIRHINIEISDLELRYIRFLKDSMAARTYSDMIVGLLYLPLSNQIPGMLRILGDIDGWGNKLNDKVHQVNCGYLLQKKELFPILYRIVSALEAFNDRLVGFRKPECERGHFLTSHVFLDKEGYKEMLKWFDALSSEDSVSSHHMNIPLYDSDIVELNRIKKDLGLKNLHDTLIALCCSPIAVVLSVLPLLYRAVLKLSSNLTQLGTPHARTSLEGCIDAC